MVDSVVWVEFPEERFSDFIGVTFAVVLDDNPLNYAANVPAPIVRNYLGSPAVHEDNPSGPFCVPDGSDFVADHSFEEFFFYGWVVDFV